MAPLVAGDEMKFGAIPTPVHILAKVPYIHSYMDEVLAPLIPDQTVYSAAVKGQWGDLGNIEYSDCIFAGFGHYKQCTSVNASGVQAVVTTDQVLGWYSDVKGFVKGDPSTDNGAYPIEALNYFVDCKEIAAYARVNLADPACVARAVNLFGGMYTVVTMPTAWKKSVVWGAGPNLSGVWAPGSWGNHCLYTPDYNSSMTLNSVSWGTMYPITEDGYEAYMPEAYVLLSDYWVNTVGKTIQGFDLSGLTDALKLVA